MTSLRIERATGPDEGWERLARDHGGFYHDPKWIRAIARGFRLRVHWLVARQEGTAVGILPLAEVPSVLRRPRLSSLPFGYAAGPVAPTAAIDAALVNEAVCIAQERRLRRVEVKRIGTAVGPGAQYVRVLRYATYRVDTSGGVDAVLQRLDPGSTRRGIRRAERAGVQVRVADATRDWLAFARLQEQTSARLGLPPPPRAFFTHAAFNLQREGRARLYLAHARGRPIGGTVVWQAPREWIYAFGASQREDLDLRPNHALLWAALRDAVDAGVTFDLGRAAPEQEGLITFKRRWGGRPIPLAYDYWPDVGGLHAAPRHRGLLAGAGRVWRLLPAGVGRWGSFIYRYLG